MKVKKDRLIERILHSHERADLAIAAEYILGLKDEIEIFRLLEIRNSFLIEEQLFDIKDDVFLELEKILLERQSKILNLSLALFGSDGDILRELFLRGEDPLKSACLKNRRASIVFDESDRDRVGWLTISFLAKEKNSFEYNQWSSLYSNSCISFETLAYLINPESIIANKIGLEKLIQHSVSLGDVFDRLKSNLGDRLNFDVIYDADKIKKSLRLLLEAISTYPEHLIGSKRIFELAYDSGIKLEIESHQQLLDRIYSLDIPKHDKKERGIAVYIHAQENVSSLSSMDPASRYAFLRVAKSLDYKKFEARIGGISVDSNMYDAILENHLLWNSAEKREWIASSAPSLDDMYRFEGALLRMKLKHPEYFLSPA